LLIRVLCFRGALTLVRMVGVMLTVGGRGRAEAVALKNERTA
jgi:hypothetical protein